MAMATYYFGGESFRIFVTFKFSMSGNLNTNCV